MLINYTFFRKRIVSKDSAVMVFFIFKCTVLYDLISCSVAGYGGTASAPCYGYPAMYRGLVSFWQKLVHHVQRTCQLVAKTSLLCAVNLLASGRDYSIIYIQRTCQLVANTSLYYVQ